MSRAKVGDIMTVHGPKGRLGYGGWFIVEKFHGRAAVGCCFIAPKDRKYFNPRDRKLIALDAADRVNPNDVPDHVWAELAKWRLMA